MIVACAACLTAGLGLSGLVLGADNCSGHYVTVGNKSVSINDDPAEPAHIMVGECRGWVCVRKDKNGDEQTVESAYTTGESYGTWKVLAGTGRYANARWSGWYKERRASDDVAVGDWGGNCE